MSEEKEGQETGADAIAGIDAAAMALALNGASREDAGVFLKKQGALIDDQRHHLHEQYKQLRLGTWEKRLGVLLRVGTAMVGFAAAAGVALLIWDAAHAQGLIIAPFSVAPDMASRGITGQVVASQVLDKITTMQSITSSNRPAQSFANNWGDDIKVEIPETGISVGEFYHFLRGWLGHDIQISGEVYHTAKGIAVTARVGADSGATFAGPEADLDALVQKAAEHVYGDTQPYRFSQFLYNAGRPAETLPILNKLTSGASTLERAWGWNGLSTGLRGRGNLRAAIVNFRKAIAIYPDFTPDYHTAALAEFFLGQFEAALADYRTTKELLTRNPVPALDARVVPKFRLDTDQFIAFLLGDFAAVVSLGRAGDEAADDQGTEVTHETFRDNVLKALALQHDGAGARAYFSEMPAPFKSLYSVSRARARLHMEAALENWQAVSALEPDGEKLEMASETAFAEFGPQRGDILETELRPRLALAKARLGDVAGGEALIATTPGDCYDCVLTRAQIAEQAGQSGRADYWFARAVQQAPSIPFAYADWGQVLLARGNADAAIAKFTLANQKGPHFADPLEMWGEALMAKKQPGQALTKFADAEKYAPNWGRLHLKWGEALTDAGKKDEARKQFTKAARLDLSSADKAELVRQPLQENRI